jgi:hypothetical protein
VPPISNVKSRILPLLHEEQTVIRGVNYASTLLKRVTYYDRL